MAATDDGGTTETAGTTDELDEVLAWNAYRAARVIGRRMSERLAPHGLNPMHFGILAFLARTPRMTTAEIARAVLVRPQSMAPLLDGLEERGLTRRTGVRARGRPNPVELTDEGRAALAAIWGPALDGNDLGDVGLSTAESRELNRLLLAIVRAEAPTDPADDPFPPDALL